MTYLPGIFSQVAYLFSDLESIRVRLRDYAVKTESFVDLFLPWRSYPTMDIIIIYASRWF